MSVQVRTMWLFASTVALIATPLAAQKASVAQSGAAKTAHKTAKLKWGPMPNTFPKGARMAVVSGDPSKSGPFAVDLSFPAGYKIAPHWHPTDEHVTVKSGTLLFGMGDKLDLKAAKVMKAGDSGSVTANMHHYAAARGKTVIEVSANGPFTINYVNPSDDPSKKK